ncbi:autotransporter outer membrane beta-barrel domain-containing protein (plasmid) [Pseudomonas aeruginosa]|uniref:autotransporter outer membrane beta-barrel domain-containing protein n=1 Tax=Pseudomonas aeruginosa TaxID=287 RepID=UPI00236436D2|nr:autotransporter outer membrane beta-barrel domain-containing protein [Pseudomonas aeruginosa]
MGTQSLVSNAINSRLGSSSGMSSGDVLQETGVWIKALHSDADQNRRNQIEGFSADTDGIIIGADGKLNEQTTLGLAYSYATSDVDSDDGNSTDVKSQALIAYGSWKQGPVFVDASLTFGKNDNESKRHIAGTTAKGDYDSDLFGLNVLGGYGFNVGDGYIVEPRAALRYSNLKIDGYTEKGLLRGTVGRWPAHRSCRAGRRCALRQGLQRRQRHSEAGSHPDDLPRLRRRPG